MKFMTEHPSKVGESYYEHYCYACKMAWKLYVYAFRVVLASFLFTVHAALPFIPIPKRFNLLAIGESGKEFHEEGVRRDAKAQEYEATRGSRKV